MKKYAKYAILFLFVLTVFWPSPAYAKDIFDDKVVFGGTYTLESGQSLDGDLVIFGGAVTTEADSTVNGDIVLIGGVVEVGGLHAGLLEDRSTRAQRVLEVGGLARERRFSWHRRRCPTAGGRGCQRRSGNDWSNAQS